MYTNEGVLDLHLHALPDLFERSGDELSFARHCQETGMIGFAVKNVLESTVSRAYYVNQMVPGFRYIGGICLNYTVGGINPTAVDATLQMGGRIVWMPSGHSRFHLQLKGAFGNYGRTHRIWLEPDAPGISILDEKGELTAETKAVVALVKENNALLATSHLSPEESLKLIRYCEKEKVKTVYTHILWTPEYSLEVAKEAVEHGCTIEICAAKFTGINKTPLPVAIQAIKEIGYENMIISSDAGKDTNLVPYEMLRAFGVNLLNNGVSQQMLHTMMHDKPLELIDG